MGRIFCIIGKSGSGKDTVFKCLINDKELDFSPVVTYTTRPIRNGEHDGIEYHFVDENRLEILKAAGKIIELREYDTVMGKWYYFTADDGGIDLLSRSYLMIATVESYLSLRTYYGVDAVIPVYIEVEDGMRLQRALDREKAQTMPKYEEMCRRYLADGIDFSQKRLMSAGISKAYQNDSLESCINTIKADIMKLII